MRLALITPSFSRDHPLCVDLCRSIDTYLADDIEHVLIVPEADKALFAPLAGPRRRIMTDEEVLPTTLWKLPLPTRIGIPGVWHKRIRTLYLTPKLRVTRGWLIQQVVKMSAHRVSDAEGFVFVDSDIAFVRPFGTDTFVRDGKLRFLYEPDCIYQWVDQYTRWQDVACDLLGIDRFPFANDNYIGAGICWRRDRLAEVRDRIEATAGRPYHEVLLGQTSFAEYVIYGTYCRHVIKGDTGHYETPRSFCLGDWVFDTSDPAGYSAFVNGLADDHVAVLIQSTNEWPTERRRAAIDAIRQNAGLAA
ncbi:DUF6492 family protein [Acuticoccus sediminis]|uniref:DUF6492 family protein n=1 Tax=Acuticoccus sediminis TaxID=2184697 RepID=UPI001CFEFC6C|nr:DUF6492 family protein [Acuticoccus sediminis]